MKFFTKAPASVETPRSQSNAAPLLSPTQQQALPTGQEPAPQQSGSLSHSGGPDIPLQDRSLHAEGRGTDLEQQQTGDPVAQGGGRWMPTMPRLPNVTLPNITLPNVSLPSPPTLEQMRAVGASAVGAVSGVADAMSKGIKRTMAPPLEKTVDALPGFGKTPTLSKQTTSYSSLWYSKTKSTISEPLSIADKSDKIRESMTLPATAKVRAGAADVLSIAATDRTEVLQLAKVNSDALAHRLQRNRALLNQLRDGSTATRDDLHQAINSTLKPTAFTHTARFVRTAATIPPLDTGYVDRQVDTVDRTPEAHIEQGIKTLNLLSESRAFEASIRLNAAAATDPAERTALRESLARLVQQRADTAADMADFAAHYKTFVERDLGVESPGLHLTTQIDRIADPDTAPAQRDRLHAEVMARAIGERRVDVALEAVTDLGDQERLLGRINDLRADPRRLHSEDCQVMALVSELTGDTGLGAREGTRQFLQKLAEMKGPPLDEVLRVDKDIYRSAWTPAGQAPADAPGKVRFEQARDMEKVNIELTSIAVQVRSAIKTQAFQRQLDALFAGEADNPGAQVESKFQESFGRLIARQPGDPVSAQDKANVKLAKCILDHGAGVKDLAANLQRAQERYITDLGDSPDMLKMLRNGSTGASYDPVEQRANGRMRLDALRASLVDMDPAHEPRSTYQRDDVAHEVDAAKALLAAHGTAEPGDAQAAAREPAARELRQRLFLMENYVRDANATDPAALVRQLADNDPRCGTDAVIAENVNLSGNFGVSGGGRAGSRTNLYGGGDGAVAAQFPSDRNPWVRNQVPNSLVLLESSAYSMKSISDLETTVYKGTLKGNFAVGATSPGMADSSVPVAFSAAFNAGVGFERVTIKNKGPGLVCMVHKAPVLDGTASNAKLAGATHLAINDTVNQALFSRPEVGALDQVPTAIEGWDNLNRFFAATDRATLEPLRERKEVTTTLSFGGGGSPGMTASHSFAASGENQGRVAERGPALGVDGKLSHSFREETLRTATLEKVTISDTFSDTRTASAGFSMRLGGGVLTDGGKAALVSGAAHAVAENLAQQLGADHPEALEARSTADAASDAAKGVPRFRYGSNIDLAKLGRGIEHSREYRELYKRVVRDQFGNEIPSLVRDSKTSTDGRLLANNLVNEIGLLSATVSQRIDAGGRDMSPLERETVTKLLCLSTLASHYDKAGTLTQGGTDLVNDNLTINVTAALTPAAAARLAAVKITQPADARPRQSVLQNSLNYATIGAAGGFKNQDTSAKFKGLMGRSKRSTSSAQSAGYPSGTDMLSADKARALDSLLRRDENSDLREALESAGMGRPIELLQQYDALKDAMPPV